MPVSKPAISLDGNLHLKVIGIPNKADLEVDLRMHKEEFVTRRFDLMTISFESLSYIYWHPRRVVPVLTDRGCRSI
jgi:hypothetical protein